MDRLRPNKRYSAGRKTLIAFISFLSLITIIVIAFIIWAQFYYSATESALSNLNSNDTVTVSFQGNDIFFNPTSGTELKKTGLIFYPGGKVDEKAYSYIGKYAAEEGYFSSITGMPLKLAVLNPEAAGIVIKNNPRVVRWVIAGHSLGGSMAANFAYNNPGIVSGLVLLASYPAGSNDLSLSSIKVISLFGTSDGVVNMESLEQSKNLLPKDTEFIEIEGGNHSQFGDYGFQSGDNPASISTFKQNKAVAGYIIKLMEEIEKGY